uniref:Resolvase/invertase-type recombinase catalytic domain-containing protein n=1 Tax=Heterorhabditis bacteriophora TaxID=37862 RepID=A0A1I7XU00_HETBA
MFFSGICRVARQRGVQIKNECAQVTDLPSEADELIEQHFKRCRKSNIDIIICLTREKKDSVHGMGKFYHN